MMKKLSIFLVLSTLAVFLAAGNVQALPTIDDGVFNPTEWAGYYASEDDVGPGGFVGPGWGGQAYDVEDLGLIITADKVYFGLQTGFDVTQDSNNPATAPAKGPGDFALDVNGDGNYDYAIDFNIDTSTSNVTYSLYQVSSWEDVNYTTDPYDFSESNPFQMKNGTLIGSWTDPGAYGYDSVSYVLEGAFDKSMLALYNGGKMTLHWTMWCGNDHLEQTSAPVPEPTTILLSGLGLLGMGCYLRKRSWRQKKA